MATAQMPDIWGDGKFHLSQAWTARQAGRTHSWEARPQTHWGRPPSQAGPAADLGGRLVRQEGLVLGDAADMSVITSDGRGALRFAFADCWTIVGEGHRRPDQCLRARRGPKRASPISRPRTRTAPRAGAWRFRGFGAGGGRQLLRRFTPISTRHRAAERLRARPEPAGDERSYVSAPRCSSSTRARGRIGRRWIRTSGRTGTCGCGTRRSTPPAGASLTGRWRRTRSGGD